MKKIAIYPGTFDPITYGHLDVIERSLKFVDKLIVGVTTNPKKTSLFTQGERVELAKKATKKFKNVQVKSFNDLTVDFAKRNKACLIIRGLREITDFAFEFQRATINRKLCPTVETIFVTPNEKYYYLNSSVVKEVTKFKGKIKDFVPKEVEKALKNKIPYIRKEEL